MSNFYGRAVIFHQSIEPPTVYKISGNVKLGGANQQNAIVNCIDENTLSVVGQKLTDASGNYSFDSGYPIQGTHTYHVTAQYYSAGTYYDSLSQPYVTPATN